MPKAAPNPTHVFYHDIFNVIALMAVCYFDCYYLYLAGISKLGTSAIGEGLEAEFANLAICFMTYLFIDLTWVLVQPTCVGSDPKFIIIHHLVTAVLCTCGLLEERQVNWHFAIAVSVELNTLFLTARRLSKKPSALYTLFEVMFYLSWVILRLIMFPVLAVFFWYEACRYGKETGRAFNFIFPGSVLQCVLSIMSYKWTYDLLRKLFRKSKKDA